MDQSGSWDLSPAYDMTYSYNPSGNWTASHQMSLNGKRDNFTIEDFRACAKNASMKRGRADEIIKQVQDTVSKWKYYSQRAGVSDDIADGLKKSHHTDILKWLSSDETLTPLIYPFTLTLFLSFGRMTDGRLGWAINSLPFTLIAMESQPR